MPPSPHPRYCDVMLNELGKKILRVRCTVYSALDKYAEEVPNSDFDLSEGAYIMDVRKIFGFMEPLPPCPHFG